MARIKAFRALDMSETGVWYGTIVEATQHRIAISDGRDWGGYLGTFAYSQSRGLTGELTGYAAGTGGRTTFVARGLEVDAAWAFREVETGSVDRLVRFALRGDDRIVGSRQDDALRGFGGDDVLVGSKGDDALRGSGGDDRLIGGAGRDRLHGDDGDDVLAGGRGRDRLTGGEGRDVFVFEGGATDVVRDFENGRDRIEVSGARQFADLEIHGRHGDAVVSFDGASIVLEDVRKGHLDADDFLFG